MKKFIFLLSFLAVLSTQIQAQWNGGRLDSLSASSSVDTAKFYPGGSLYGLATMGNTWVSKSAIRLTTPCLLNINIVSDSISGSTDGNVFVQSFNGTGTPREKDWVTLTDGTFTVYRNGALAATTGGIMALNKNVSGYSLTRQYGQYVNTNFGGRQFRVIALCPSSTQVTTVGVQFKVTPVPSQ